MDRQATIKDVAARAGVSFKTVSRVLNGEPHVREEIRERVTSAAAELGYRPNIAARGLIGAPSRLIGFLYDNPNYNYVTEAELGALKRCRTAGYHLAIEPIDNTAEAGVQVDQILSSLRLDGLILTPPLSENAQALDRIDRQGVPYVRIAPGDERPGVPSVLVDDEHGAYGMTRRLIQLGHRRIGFIKGHPDHSAAWLRLAGYLRAIKDEGLEPADGDVAEGDFTFDAGFLAARRMLDRADRPTAIFAANDMMALGAMAAARDLGLEIPKDLSVGGFDDMLAARMCWPQLTTVRQPIAEMYEAAAAILISAASGEALDQDPIRLRTQLIERGSTAPPP